MSESIFRGFSQQAKKLNTIGEDIESLCEMQIGGEGEPTKKTFPVRSQLTWFRLVHNTGSIRTKKISSDDEHAEFEAEVYDSQGRFLQNGHGTATYTDDGVHGYKLIETAESRSIARALSGAGFGCQLNLGYYDEAEPGGPGGPGRGVLSNGQSDSTDGTPTGGSMDAPVQKPGTVNGQMRIAGIDSDPKEYKEPGSSSDAADGMIQTPHLTLATNHDVAGTREKAPDNPPPAGKPARGRKAAPKPQPSDEGQKNADVNPAVAAQKETDDTVDGAQAAPAAAAPAQAQEVSKPPEIGGEAQKPAIESPAEHEENPSPSPDDKAAANLVYERMKTQFEQIKATPTEINNSFFTADSVNEAGKYINMQKALTRMDAMELQHAITVLEAEKDSYKHIPAPLHENSERYGMTFGELMQDTSGTGKNLIAALSNMYRKDDTLAFAAALVCTKENNLKLVESPAA